MSAVELQPERIIAGRYRLTRPLAKGGMGFVWVAWHLQLDIDVAIKFMAPASMASPEARARFEREAKASARLQSPNVVQIYDYGIEDDMPFLVMELLRGEDLEARLRREGRLSLADTRKIVEPVCLALVRAHEAGLVHRDLKPANLFVGRGPAGSSEASVVKVLDFGIAKDTHLGLVDIATKTGSLVGSPHYMSPEQVRRSRGVDHRSDLWSLGVIVFRCLTGQLPFPGDEIGDVLVEVCADPIPIPSQLDPRLGPEVDRFIARALSRDLEQRFQSAGEMLAAFSQASSAAHSASTFAPAASHNDAPPARDRRLRLGLSALGGAFMIGLGALFALRLSSFSSDARPAASAMESASDANAAAISGSASVPVPPPIAAPPSSDPAEAALAPSAAPSASASTAPGARRPPSSAPSRNRVRTKNDDLLKEM